MVFCEAAEKALEKSQALSFDRGTVSFLSANINAPDIQMANSKDREKIQRSVATQEEKLGLDKVAYRGPYDYENDECLTIANRIDRSIKCLSIVGKSLVSLNEILERTDKDLIVDSLISTPNKILYQMMHGIDTDFDQTAIALHNLLMKEGIENIELEDVKTKMRLLCIVICLSLYDQVAFDCSTSGTINLFLDLEDNDTNIRIQKLCMVCCAYEPNRVIDYAISMMDNAKKEHNIIEIFAIRVLINYYLTQHRGIPNPLLQRCSSKIFDGEHRVKRIVANRGDADTIV